MSVHHLTESTASWPYILLALFFVVAVGASNGNKYRRYKKGAYSKITKTPYLSMKRDAGKYGEYLVYENLRHFEDTGAKFLMNLHIPKLHDQKTEIDVLLICSKGLFVFESKNLGGWIFGNENHQNWTQSFPKG